MGYPLATALNRLSNAADRLLMTRALNPVYDEMSSQALTTSGLVISGAAAVTAKTGAVATIALVKGRLMSVAAGTALPALVGSVTNARFNVYAFFLTSTGAIVSAMGVESTTLQGVAFPAIPAQTATLGFIIINPTGAGAFVGGTTPLDSAGVVPNAQYISTIGAFDPSTTI